MAGENAGLVAAALNIIKAHGFPPGTASRRRGIQRMALVGEVWWIWAVQLRLRTVPGDPDHGWFRVEAASLSEAWRAHDPQLSWAQPDYAVAHFRTRLQRPTPIDGRDADWWQAGDLASGALARAVEAQGRLWLAALGTDAAQRAQLRAGGHFALLKRFEDALRCR